MGKFTWYQHGNTLLGGNIMKNIEELRQRYVGKKVHVIINDPYRCIDAWGTVEHVDDMGQLHGTWGGLGAIPGEDYISLED